ncbi:MAG: hypothetical protein QOC81_4930 [Thermoanaerobaculia bacterium]|jgi:hypothetical protein|nr:hypothetical protein [Thermoanaerobaculia bacterium]
MSQPGAPTQAGGTIMAIAIDSRPVTVRINQAPMLARVS